jgi:hypothetical protein
LLRNGPDLLYRPNDKWPDEFRLYAVTNPESPENIAAEVVRHPPFKHKLNLKRFANWKNLIGSVLFVLRFFKLKLSTCLFTRDRETAQEFFIELEQNGLCSDSYPNILLDPNDILHFSSLIGNANLLQKLALDINYNERRNRNCAVPDFSLIMFPTWSATFCVSNTIGIFLNIPPNLLASSSSFAVAWGELLSPKVDRILHICCLITYLKTPILLPDYCLSSYVPSASPSSTASYGASPHGPSSYCPPSEGFRR